MYSSLHSPMLKEWRIRMEWSEVRAARELGCSRMSYRKWERAPDLTPRYIHLAALALERGIDVHPAPDSEDGTQ